MSATTRDGKPIKNIAFDDVKKKYYVSVYLGKDKDGKGVRYTETFPSLEKAREALKEKLKEKNAPDKPTWTVAPKQVTFAEYMDYFFENCLKGKAETTVYGYKKIRDKLVKHIGATKLSKISPAIITEYYQHLRTDYKLSENTIIKHHDFLLLAFNKAIELEFLSKSPMATVTMPKYTKPEIHYYTAEQLSDLFELIQGDKIATAVILCACLGLRRSEACYLRWDAIDLDNRTITIKGARTQAGGAKIEKDTKSTDSWRKLSIDDITHDTLQAEKAKQDKFKVILGADYKDGDYIVCWEDGAPIRPNYISECFTDFIVKSKLPTITLHGLRHSFATIAIDSKTNMYQLSKALGHSSQKVTEGVYVHQIRQVQSAPISAVSGAIQQARQAKESK